MAGESGLRRTRSLPRHEDRRVHSPAHPTGPRSAEPAGSRPDAHSHVEEEARLDGLPVTEEFVVLVVATVAASDLGVVGDELNPFDPLNLFEAELDLVAEAQRRAVTERQRPIVHVRGCG